MRKVDLRKVAATFAIAIAAVWGRLPSGRPARWLGGGLGLVGALAVLSFALFPAAQTSGSGSGQPVVPSVRIVTGTAVTPATAATFYTVSTTSTAGLCGSAMNAAQFCSGGVVVRAPELKMLARALRADANVANTAEAQETADRIYEYVRNSIDTEFLYGVHKGALGASIDRSGTVFDQAQLMVELLREAGLTARYQQGTITLNAAQFTAWTGLNKASAACDFLATGGIPYQSTAGCGSGAIGSITMAHVWVQADIGGVSYLFDPAYKPYQHKAGLGRAALHSAMGLATGGAAAAASSGMSQGSQSGVGYVAGLNGAQLASTLQGYSNGLLARMGQEDLQGADLGDVIGGREILPATRPTGGWKQTAFAYTAAVSATWVGNIPNQYRAKLRVVATRGADPIFDTTFYVDEIYGRRLELASRAVPYGTGVGNPPQQPYHYLPQLKLDGVVLAEAATAADQIQLIRLLITADHPFAALNPDSTPYADSSADKLANILLPTAVVHGWGQVSSALAAKWEQEQFEDSVAVETRICGGGDCEMPPPMPAGDLLRARLGASWLAQFSRSSEIHAELSDSRLVHHHSIGVVTGDYGTDSAASLPINTLEPEPDQPAGFGIFDESSVVDVESSFGLISRTSDALNRRAALHAIAASAAALEGSVLEQLTQTPDAASTARRFAWGNSPEFGETPTTASRRVYRYPNQTVGGSSASLVVVENLLAGYHATCITCNDHDSVDGDDRINDYDSNTGALIGQNIIEQFRQQLFSAIVDYTAAGYDVTASSEALLGPGHRLGTEVLWNVSDSEYYGMTTYDYHRLPSRQNGGALIANKYDANGDPTQIAHVLTRHRGRIKGGGGPSVGQLRDVDTAAAADLIRDQFVDRSAAAGVDLMSGRAGWSSPTLMSVGQGESPHRLETRVEFRGDQKSSTFLAPDSIPEPTRAGVVSNWDGSASISSSGLEAMGASRIEAAAPTIAAFAALQDIYRAAPDDRREVIGALVSDWWVSAIRFNVVSVAQGASSEQHLNTGSGWLPAAGGAAKLTITGTPQLVRPAFGLAQRRGFPEQQESATRYWKFDAMSFSLRGASGDVRAYGHWALSRTSGAPQEMNRWSGFRLNTWTFPAGVTLTLNYPSAATAIPSTVSSNLGLSIAAFPTAGTNGYQDAGARWHKVIGAPYSVRSISTRPVEITRVAATFQPGDLVTPAVRYTYGATNQIIQAEDAIAIRMPAERRPHRFFAAEGYRGERIDPLGGRYAVERLQGGRLTRHIDEEGRVSLASFDGRGRVTSRTTAWGDRTEFKYDARDNVIELKRLSRAGCGTDVVWCQTSTTTATWHPTWNKPLTVTRSATTLDGQAASTWTFAYNAQGLPETQTSPVVFNGRTGGNEAAVWRTYYDSFGRVRGTLDPTGIATRTEYGGYGQPNYCITHQHAADQSGSYRQTTAFACNAAGDVVITSDARGNVTTATYDALRRKVSETGPASTGIQTQWTYDLDGNVTEERRWDSTAAVWHATTTTYSLTGKPLTVTDPSGDVARTCYDGLDRATVAVDPTGRATRTSYNLASQPTLVERWFTASVTDATCALTNTRPAHLSTNRWRAMEYNAGGLQSAEIDGNGNRTTMTYDGLGRQMLTTFADGKYIQTIRNERDQVTQTVKRSGDVHQAYYDPLGRVERIWEHGPTAAWPVGRITRTSYDLASRPVLTDVSTQTTTTFDNALLRDIRTYGYDPAGRVQYDRVTPNNGAMGSTEQVLTYVYDLTNNRTSIQWPDGYQATYTFDAANRATRVAFGAHSADIAVDSLSRRTSLNRSNGVNTSYAYETDSDLSQINTAWAASAGQTPAIYGFQHDPAGRITGLAINRPDLEWSPSPAYAQTYGVPTNLNQTTSRNGVALVWDDNGNLLSQGSTTYQWTWGNRLVRVLKPGTTTEYAYDSQDRRTVVIEDAVMTRTLWSGADEVAEYDIAGVLKRRFIPDGSGSMDARLATVNPDNTIHWHHTDHQGSVIATSNGAGQAAGFTNYSPHGEFGTAADGSTRLTAPPPGSPFGYTGRQWDAKAGLYQYRARYYDPVLGVFLSMDPIGTKDDPNLYGYVAQDPVNKTDPTGLQSHRDETPHRSSSGGNTSARTRVDTQTAATAASRVDAAVTATSNAPSRVTVDEGGQVRTGGPQGGPYRGNQSTGRAAPVAAVAGTVGRVTAPLAAGLDAAAQIEAGKPVDQALVNAGGRSAFGAGVGAVAVVAAPETLGGSLAVAAIVIYVDERTGGAVGDFVERSYTTLRDGSSGRDHGTPHHRDY